MSRGSSRLCGRCARASGDMAGLPGPDCPARGQGKRLLTGTYRIRQPLHDANVRSEAPTSKVVNVSQQLARNAATIHKPAKGYGTDVQLWPAHRWCRAGEFTITAVMLCMNVHAYLLHCSRGGLRPVTSAARPSRCLKICQGLEARCRVGIRRNRVARCSPGDAITSQVALCAGLGLLGAPLCSPRPSSPPSSCC